MEFPLRENLNLGEIFESWGNFFSDANQYFYTLKSVTKPILYLILRQNGFLRHSVMSLYKAS